MVDAELFYEREAEYFGFTPYKFLDEVGTRVVGAVLGVFERLTGRLASLPFLGRGQSEAGLGQWSAFVEARFGRNYELFETYVVKNVLCLPDAFVLPHRRLDQCTSLSGKSQSEPSVQIQSLELLENLDHADANICSLLERKKSAELETCRLMALKHEIERQELIISQVENQFSILQEKLARWGPFEMSANKLEDHIKDLLQIVQATIEESRNLSDAQPFPGETIHFQSIFPNSHEEGVKSGFQSPRLCDLERELVDCQKMATFADLDAICGVNQQSTAITST